MKNIVGRFIHIAFGLALLALTSCGGSNDSIKDVSKKTITYQDSLFSFNITSDWFKLNDTDKITILVDKNYTSLIQISEVFDSTGGTLEQNLGYLLKIFGDIEPEKPELKKFEGKIENFYYEFNKQNKKLFLLLFLKNKRVYQIAANTIDEDNGKTIKNELKNILYSLR